MRSRIWAWMVTSSAVVGSSAMSNLGSQARPMAIITRWRRPPESSWGYCPSRSAGRGISTMVSTSSARWRASCLETSLCSITASVICRPMDMVGLSEVRGSWGMSATSLPRTRRISRSSSEARSRPNSRMLPPLRWPLLGSRRMIEKPVVLLPQPDSPTTPRHSPSSTSNETSSTATTDPWRRWNSVRSPATSSTGAIGRSYYGWGPTPGWEIRSHRRASDARPAGVTRVGPGSGPGQLRRSGRPAAGRSPRCTPPPWRRRRPGPSARWWPDR